MIFKRHLYRTLPFSVLLLAACGTQSTRPPLDGENTYVRDDKPAAASSAVNPSTNGTGVVSSNMYDGVNPGYVLFTAGNYDQATSTLERAHAAQPADPYIQLDLAAAYQRHGRMDLAEPLYRQAMVSGHDTLPPRVSMPTLQGQTIAQIACYDLSIGLPPASPETARPCQPTIAAAAVQEPKSYRIYFAVDQAALNDAGRKDVHELADDARRHPAQRIALVGKASSPGGDNHNMRLSRRRAAAVKDALMADGVDKSRIDERWVGDRELAVAEQPRIEEPANRVVMASVSN